MIISRTPFRISFAGGGTDIPSFYKEETGAVVSTAINKYMYITVNKYFDDRIILKYSRTEEVRNVRNIRHPLIRECMKLVGIQKGIEITSMADVVGGTGLGSSSSFTVGVLHALHAFKGEYVPSEQLAREACEVEIVRVGEPIGKQDQHIAAFGGFQYMEFLSNEQVQVSPIICSMKKLENLQRNLLLFYTGKTRKSSTILRRLRKPNREKKMLLRRLKGLAQASRHELQEGGIEDFGRILQEGWEIKKRLGGGISTPEIDRTYNRALRSGAIGGKILGAGGGGFLLLYASSHHHARLRKAMKGWKEVRFKFEPEGSKIVYVSS